MLILKTEVYTALANGAKKGMLILKTEVCPFFKIKILRLYRQMATSSHRAAELIANYREVKMRINNIACGKPVRLVAVSKTKPIGDLQTLIEIGHKTFGENYVFVFFLAQLILRSKN